MSSDNLQVQLQRWVAMLGLPGLVGLALLAFAAWGEWMLTPARLAQIADLNEQTARLRRAKPGELPREERPQALLADLYARLPAAAERSAALSALLRQARTEGLSVDSVQFRAQLDRTTGLMRHEINLPLKGNYPALRKWVEHSLQEQPALSVDAIEVKREQPQVDPIEARVKATLWVRPGGAHAVAPQPLTPLKPLTVAPAASARSTVTAQVLKP